MMLRRVTKLVVVHHRIFNGVSADHNPNNHYRLLQKTLLSTNTNNRVNIVHNRQIMSPNEDSVQFKSWPEVNIILYRFEPLPFYHRLKVFLDYYDIPYKIAGFDSLGKYKIEWSRRKILPLLEVDGKMIVDSMDLKDSMNILAKKFHLDLAARSVIEHNEEKLWLRWVNNELAFILIFNMHRSFYETVETHEYLITGGANFVTKYGILVASYCLSKAMKIARINIADERAALYDAVETWVDALNGQDFQGGNKPNMVDLAVYGVMEPMRNCKSGRDMLKNTRIGDWYSRMENVVEKSSEIQA